MTETERRPGEEHRGDVDDHHRAGEVSRPEGIPRQLRRRRVASWRCEPLPSGLWDPWRDRRPDVWSAHEVDAWRAAAEQLRKHGVYGSWQLPESVRTACSGAGAA